MHTDYAFYMGATPGNAGALGVLEKLPGVAGVKVFLSSSTGDLLLDRDESVLCALRSGRRRMAIHAEDEERLKARRPLALPGQPETHPVWRDPETARLATERILRLARQTARRTKLARPRTACSVP